MADTSGQLAAKRIDGGGVTVPGADTQKQRGQTAYVILRYIPDTGEKDHPKWEVVRKDIGAASSNAAIKAFAAINKQPGTYAAIPARSFQPVKVEIEQTTVVKVGEPT